MKASKLHTFTGEWLNFEDFTRDDFDIIISDVQYKDFGKAYQSTIVITLKAEVQKALMDAWGDDEEDNRTLWQVLAKSGMMESIYKNAIVPMVIYFSDTVRLQNVRLNETKNIRMSESKARLKNLISNVSQKMIDEKIANANKGIHWQIDKMINSEVLKRAEGTLRWYDPWADEADEKANNTDLLDEIQELKSKLSTKKLELRQKRNNQFKKMFEAEGWKCPDEKTPLPEPIVKKWKEMLKNNEGFKVSGRHSIFN